MRWEIILQPKARGKCDDFAFIITIKVYYYFIYDNWD